MADIEYMPCYREHLELIAEQMRDSNVKAMQTRPEYATLLLKDFAMSAWLNSRCLGAAGIITLNKNRGVAWALVSRNAGPYMRQITAKVKDAIDIHPCPRIEMNVACDFKQGHTWARLLGFACEAPRMRKSGLFGEDETLYARVKE